MKILVLGAGVIGVTSAWYLRQQGHHVTVIERQSGVAAETSYANGGQISVCHAEPWAKPAAIPQLLSWLVRSDAPLKLRLRADLAQWSWLARFLLECMPNRSAQNLRDLVTLGLYSRTALGQLRDQLNIDYQQRQCGILHVYTNADAFAKAHAPARAMSRYGCERTILDRQSAVAIEPALAALERGLVGATFSPNDESGDANLFTRELARHCVDAGVSFRFNTDATALRNDGHRLSSVELRQPDGAYEEVQADTVLLATGSFANQLLKPLKLSIPVYPAKGYSVTFRVGDDASVPRTALIDDEFKLVFSRLGERLRVAGTAELTGFERQLDRQRCEAIMHRAQALFPALGKTPASNFWAGLRPSSPSNVPIIGATKLAGLFVNTGHGTLGWTMACGSAVAISQIISDKQTTIDFPFLQISR